MISNKDMIGCLVWVGFRHTIGHYSIGILAEIKEINNKFCYRIDNSTTWYDYCKPTKPNDVKFISNKFYKSNLKDYILNNIEICKKSINNIGRALPYEGFDRRWDIADDMWVLCCDMDNILNKMRKSLDEFEVDDDSK